MKVSIEETGRRIDNHHVVIFTCSKGRGMARWAGKRDPVVGQLYDAELDVDDVIELGRNATISEAQECGLRSEGEGVVICGRVESQDVDGMTYVRLAPDCLLMVESEDKELQAGICLRLTISGISLVLTPQGG